MATNFKWTAIAHSQSPEHIILVAYRSIGSGLNDVVAVSPLYDLRDMNLSGSVSLTEAGWTAATRLVDPLYIFRIINSLGNASCVADAARQLRDYKLYNEALAGVLETTFKLRHEILTAVMLKSFLSTPIQLNLANTGLAKLNKIGGVATFIVKTALEAAIMKTVVPAIKL